MEKLDKAYWDLRYKNGYTGWDIGYASPPLKSAIEQINDKSARILVPGAGNAYEVEYLYKSGYTGTSLLDISELAIQQFKMRLPDFPEDNIYCTNFFDHTGSYDVILEQTFFCALDPRERKRYVKHMYRLLSDGGVLSGVLFNFPLSEEGPPFGGSEDEYRQLFSEYFHIEILEPCRNSIPPRQGSELFFRVRKSELHAE